MKATWSGLARGYGRGGGDLGNGGWRVTFVAAQDAQHGHLIAREQDADLGYTGRAVLIRSPWQTRQDENELERALAEGWWDPNAAVSGALETLHRRLEHVRHQPDIDPEVAAAVEKANATIARGNTRRPASGLGPRRGNSPQEPRGRGTERA
ncbi:hypothetical protein PZ938_00040 [Luteipulveratus sp. YIM 133132]|uniref:hypothetical protein n=1 Tax=Luteipulveratus flavus TaxID=3031728 RepID=UPI0023AEBF12|nr:hypothetical protein [Luteipulveratus sp. YIM 133132]MDE9363983.1 hypothetical protein [Luteipulveratus sp. YIM 133132]